MIFVRYHARNPNPQVVMRSFRANLCLCIGICVLAVGGCASSPWEPEPFALLRTKESAPNAKSAPPPRDAFDHRSKTIYIRGSRIMNVEESRDFMGGGAIGFSYGLTDRLNMGALVYGLDLNQHKVSPIDQEAAVAVGAINVRYALVRWGRVTWFAEGGFGLVTADRHVPGNGTELNTLTITGSGFSFPIVRRVQLDTGFTLFSMTNVDVEEEEVLDWNGIELFAAIAITF